MDFKRSSFLLLTFLATVVYAKNVEEELQETRQELHNLQLLVSDLRAEQLELRQMSNDHVLMNWMKNQLVQVRQEMKEMAIAMENQQRPKADLGNELKQMRLEIDTLSHRHFKTKVCKESFSPNKVALTLIFYYSLQSIIMLKYSLKKSTIYKGNSGTLQRSRKNAAILDII